MTKNAAQQEVIEANQYVHATLVKSGEYQKSPHFRPENQKKVRALTERYSANVRSKEARAIDFGCGTGFMIDIMKDLFAQVHGVDITPEMMAQVDLSSGNVHLHESVAEHTPFNDGEFEFATAYSFMDHLLDAETFLREVHRVLKPGGVFYSGLNPNRGFILMMEKASGDPTAAASPIVDREIKGALHNGEYYAENFGLNGELLEKAEPIKSLKKGFDATEIYATAKRIGFSDCIVEYEWFLGEGKVIHEQSFEAAASIDRYLRSVLPASAPLFKYLNFILTK